MKRLIDAMRRAGIHDRVRARVGDRVVIAAQRAAAVPFRRSLTSLARIYWTDKGGGHRYTEHYARHFGHLRRRHMRLLEIGIGGYGSSTWGGASLRMWRDYFRRGQIHGLDIHEKHIEERRIEAHRGDQSDDAFMRSLARKHGPFDVIIDDGSHVNAHIRASFAALFEEHLAPGGIYVIEDLVTAYDPEFGGGPPGHSGTSVELIKDLVDAVNVEPRPVGSVHVYEQLAFIEKAGRS